MTRLSRPLLTAVLALTLMTVRPAAASQAIYEQVLKSTAWIVNGDRTASGVLVDAERRLLATNYHAVAGAFAVVVCFPDFQDGQAVGDRQHYLGDLEHRGIIARVAAADPRRDLALLELESVPDGVLAVTLATESARPGQAVHTVGNPGAGGALWTYTSGTVRQVCPAEFVTAAGLLVKARVLESQLPINPGDSGGPVVSAEGQLVGLVQGFRGDASLISICIDIEEVRSLLRGENTSVDSRASAALAELELKYVVGPSGSLQVNFLSDDESVQTVFVESATSQVGPLELRRVAGVADVFENGAPPALLELLLKRNAEMTIGTWELHASDQRQVIVLCVRIDADAGAEVLQQAIVAVLAITGGLQQELSRLEMGEAGAVWPKSLAGLWQETASDRGAPTTLRLDGTGRFELTIGEALVISGKYQFEKGELTLLVGNERFSQGMFRWNGSHRLVLETHGRKLTLVRSAETEDAASVAITAAEPQS